MAGAKTLRLERFRTDLVYNAAYDFWNLKGLLAERWAHGPIFGAVADQGNQVTLTPESGFKEDRVEAMYGLRSSSFDRELVEDVERTYSEAHDWMADVIEALDPKKTTRIAVQWFALKHVGNLDAARSANRKLRLHYYDKSRFDALVPDYQDQFAAVNSLSIEGDKQFHLTMGLVGPPHKNTMFGVADAERDSQWWMGLNVTLLRFNEDGLTGGSPLKAIDDLTQEGKEEYKRLLAEGLRVFD
jgi:hypothetical protein